MNKTKFAGERLITEAKVVAAMERWDLALVLWAVQVNSRARVLLVLLDGPATAKEIMRRIGLRENTCHRALNSLMGARLVVSREKTPSHSGPKARVYEISSGRREEPGALPVSCV